MWSHDLSPTPQVVGHIPHQMVSILLTSLLRPPWFLEWSCSQSEQGTQSLNLIDSNLLLPSLSEFTHATICLVRLTLRFAGFH